MSNRNFDKMYLITKRFTNKLKLIIVLFSQVLFSQNKITVESEFSSSWVRPSLSIIFVEFTPDIKNSNINYDPGEVNLDDLKESFNELKGSFRGLFSKNSSYSSGNLKVLNINTPKSFMNDFDIFNLNIKEENIRINKNQNYFNVVSSLYADDLISSVFYLNNNSVDFKSIENRALNSLSEELRNKYLNSLRGVETSARDYLTKEVLNKNYILIINTRKKGGEKNFKDYVAFWSLYKVHIGKGSSIDERINSWYSNYENNYSKMLGSDFPIYKIESGYFNSDGVQYNTLVKGLKKIRQKVPDFRLRSRMKDNLTISLGRKENLKVDDKFVSYLEIEDEDGKIVSLKKKGIDRVKRIGDNNLVNLLDKNINSEKTKLYGDSGFKSSKGMISVKKKEVGVGISYFLSENYGWRVDYRTKWWPNFFLYAEGEDWRGNSSVWGENAEATTVHLGIQQSFNILRNLNSSFFVGVGGADNIYSDSGTFKYSTVEDKFIKLTSIDDAIGFIENKELIRQEDAIFNTVTLGVSLGFKLFSFQMIPTIRYILKSPEGFYEDQIQYGGSVRINF